MIIQVTGPYGVGKTTFALECGFDPTKIAYIFNDIKDNPNSPSLFDEDFGGLGYSLDIVGKVKPTAPIINEVKLLTPYAQSQR